MGVRRKVRVVLNGVVWVDLLTSVTFTQHLRKVKESKGRAFQVKETHCLGLPQGGSGRMLRTPSLVLRDQC